MRGRLLSDKPDVLKARNTPAYAGKTLRRRKQSESRRKHPRVCGEDARIAAKIGTK